MSFQLFHYFYYCLRLPLEVDGTRLWSARLHTSWLWDACLEDVKASLDSSIHNCGDHVKNNDILSYLKSNPVMQYHSRARETELLRTSAEDSCSTLYCVVSGQKE